MKHSMLIRSDCKCFETFKILLLLQFIKCEWWKQRQTNLQNNINGKSLILIGLFQKQVNKLNYEKYLEV